MLSSLQIENVAVIQKANVHFEKGLNVLTGETGAGKSILIDSINAILGNRTSKDLVRTGAAKAVIRAAFCGNTYCSVNAPLNSTKISLPSRILMASKSLIAPSSPTSSTNSLYTFISLYAASGTCGSFTRFTL